jgi:hypothetical protein
MRVQAMESPAILHYSVGAGISAHFDILLDPKAPDYAEKFAAGQQRALTFLLALNDDYEGGETEFPDIGARWREPKGARCSSGMWSPTARSTGACVTRGVP